MASHLVPGSIQQYKLAAMKQLDIQRISDGRLELDAITNLLSKMPQHHVDVINWPKFSYFPSVTFAIGYGGGDLCVRFQVSEEAVLAEKTEVNQSVCQDSCVEMFFAHKPNAYLNFEFNCIGTVLVGNGRDKPNLGIEIINRIRRKSSLGTKPFPEQIKHTDWEITAAIPLDILGLQEDSISGKSFRANFYKCGDNLSKPHYLSWNSIKSENPDFHRPECFGKVTIA